MNLRDLRYVVAAADLLHFGRAAEACNASQSTLSAQIAKLEDEIGVRLFVREGRTIRLSPRAGPVIEAARKALAAADEVREVARASRNPLEGPLRLGCIATICPYLAPHLLPAAVSALPQAPIVLVEDMTAALLAGLMEGRLDAAILATDPGLERIDEIALYDEPFWLVVNAREAAARAGKAEIDVERLLLLAEGHCLRDQALDLCGERPAAGRLGDLRATSLETILHLVAAGYGETLAPQLAVASWGVAWGAAWGAARGAAWGAASGGRAGVAALAMKADASRRVRLAFRRDTPRKAAMVELARTIRACLPAEAARAAG